jgi:hypothetical protein
MQSILVKQQVLEALNKHENQDDEEDEEEQSSEEEEEEDDDGFERQEDGNLKGSEFLQFDTNNQDDDDDMDFGGSKPGDTDQVKTVSMSDEDLLLDNFYNKKQK